MILLQNPSVPTPTNPVEIDAAILDIKSELETGLIWLTNGYGRAYKNLDITNGERVYFPEIYLGKQSGSFRYTNISPDNDKTGQCFFFVRRESITEYQQGMFGFLNYDVSLIFSVNMELINSTLIETEIYQQNLVAQVRDVLTRQILGKTYQLTINNIEYLFEDVFRDFNLSEQSTIEKSPLSHFRLNLSVVLSETCPVPVLPTAPTPPLPNMSLWLKGDADVNGGTVSDGDPVSTWGDQSPKGYDFNQSVFVNQPTFLESGVNGQKGLTFTSPNYLFNLGANFFIADEGVVFIVCKRNAPSLGGAFARLMTLNAVTFTGHNFRFMDFLAVDASSLYNLNMATASLDISFGAIGTTVALLTTKKTNIGIESRRDGALFNTQLGVQSLDTNIFHSIGSWNSPIYTLEGEIYEIIIYEQLISDSDILIVEAYLKNKYAI